MDWANERYVRLYTRDTMTWKRLPWQSRLLIPAIMRKLDRSGVIDLGEDGEDGIADFIEVPAEFVQAGLPELLRREVFVVRGKRLVMPNYIVAQETRQSDAQRQRDSRERRATACDKAGQPVTESHQPSPAVTDGHPKSLQPSLAVPSLAEGEIAPARVGRLTPPANEHGKPTPYHVVGQFLAIRGKLLVGHTPGAKTLFQQPAAKDMEKAAEWLATMAPEDCADLEPAMRLACEHVRDGAPGWNKPDMAKACFLFGAIVRGWPDLREELHGCAPKPRAPANPSASKPMAVVG